MSIYYNFTKSIFGLKGLTPETREAALKTSQFHAQGPFPPGQVKENASTLDLDGKTPENTYRKNAPENRSF